MATKEAKEKSEREKLRWTVWEIKQIN